METKMFEVRDKATFIPVLCIKLDDWEDPNESYLLRRIGYRGRVIHPIQLVSFTREQSYADPFKWHDRTMYTAHAYIEEHWEELNKGAVIDVEYILGEKDEPKQSERILDGR